MNLMAAMTDIPDDDVEINVINLHNCQVRVFKPSGVLSGADLLWLYGGGLILMTAKSRDNDCR